METAMLIAGTWIAIGALIGAYCYATTPRPAGWLLGFVFVALLWPLALVPWERLGLD